MRIHRYALKLIDQQTLDLPLSYRILSVAPGRPRAAIIGYDYYLDLWAQVPEVAPAVPVTIHIFGTGHPMPPLLNLDFIGTAVMPDDYVWHVFAESVGSA